MKTVFSNECWRVIESVAPSSQVVYEVIDREGYVDKKFVTKGGAIEHAKALQGLGFRYTH